MDGNPIQFVNIGLLQGAATFSSGAERRRVPFLAPARNETMLVGRNEAISVMKAALLGRADNGPWKYAVRGLPGVGKTALATEMAYDDQVLSFYRDGVLWAALGQVRDATAELGRWAEALGVGDSTRSLTEAQDRANMIRATIGQSRMLMIADGVQSPEDGRVLASACGPCCGFILTTRLTQIALSYPGGRVPLSELDQEKSIELLESLAPGVAATEPQEVAALYEAVRGLPLALALIGKYLQLPAHSGQPRRVRAALGNVRQALEILRGSSDTRGNYPQLPEYIPAELQAVFETTYVALPEPAQQAMRFLWVFPAKPNDFSQDAFQSITGPDVPDQALYDLADSGLLENCGRDRYTMHQTVTDYAWGKGKEPKAAVNAARYFTQFIENNLANYDSLYAEYRNALRVMDLARERRLTQHFIRGMNAMYPFLENRGLYAQRDVATLLKGAERTARTAARRQGSARIAVRHAITLLHLGRAAEKCMEYDEAEGHLREAFEIAQAAMDDALASQVLLHLGIVEHNVARYDDATTDLLKAKSLSESRGDVAHQSRILQRLGDVAHNRGDLDAAEAYNAEGYVLARKSQDPERISALLLNRAVVALDRGNLPMAHDELIEALRFANKTTHLERLSGIHHALGRWAIEMRSWDQAEVHLYEALEHARAINHWWYTCTIHNEWGELHLAREEWHRAFAAFNHAELDLIRAGNRSQDIWADTQFGLARFNAKSGDFEHATKLALAAQEVFKRIKHRRLSAVTAWIEKLRVKEERRQQPEVRGECPLPPNDCPDNQNLPTDGAPC